MYFYNVNDKRLELAIEEGVAFIKEDESGDVTFLKLSSKNDLKATVEVVQWKAKNDNEEENSSLSEVLTLRSYSLTNLFMPDIMGQ